MTEKMMILAFSIHFFVNERKTLAMLPVAKITRRDVLLPHQKGAVPPGQLLK